MNLKFACFISFWILLLAGCSDKKIVITADYIINPNWDEQANAIQINRMKVKKDSAINPLTELIQEEILTDLEEDSLFRWFANAKIPKGESYKTTKIYFNKDNGFMWLDDVTSQHSKVFGKLEKDNWYKFSHLLTHPYYVYIYLDSANNVHRFNVNLANY
jgi:hypothetical protein